MEKGTHVRHRARPEWGVGIAIDDPSDGKCQIHFESHGRVTLSLDVAGHYLEELGPDEVAAHRPPTGKPPGTPQGSRCAHCNKLLNRSVYSPDNTWKSCPRCSSLEGAEHVFYEYPDGYGTSDARISDDAPDGAQSYCKTCRVGQEPTTHSQRCSSVLTF